MQLRINRKTSKVSFIILIIMILCGFQFYGYYELDLNTKRIPEMMLVPLIGILSAKQIFLKEKDIFSRIMRYLLLIWVLSMPMSILFWGQSISRSYIATAPYLFFIMFFYFVKRKFPRLTLEKIIVFFGWLYIILWLYASTRLPEITFGYNAGDEYTDDLSRGVIRINFTGRLTMILAYFYYLNKSFLEKNPKYKIFAIIFFVFIVLQVTRQLILWTGVVTVIYIFMRAKKFAVFLGIVFAGLYIGSANIQFSDDSVLGSLINISNEEMNGQLYAGENPRITEYRYFFNDWSKNIITSIFGNGVPHGLTSYGVYEENLKRQGLFLSDVGYPSMYVYVGIIGLLLYIILFFKCTFQKLPKELSYVNMFMGFMIPANLAASWYNEPDTQLAICICTYLIYAYRKNPKSLNIEDNSQK